MAPPAESLTRQSKRGDASPLVDPFKRPITYLRVSVTDRCDFRCTYCMSEIMTFLPKRDLLTLEEIDRLCSAFIDKGVKKLRLTGGEPLMRKGIMTLIRALSRHLGQGVLEELTLTTNGSQLTKYAPEIAACGIKRLNVSLDTLNPEKFQAITRRGDLEQVLQGIKAAKKAGIEIKINAVALKGNDAQGGNEHELVALMRWAHGEGHDITFIETMPLGEIDKDRTDQYLSLQHVKDHHLSGFTLAHIPYKTGGPARYLSVKETGGRLGLITPMSHNFCESCNRVRVTCTGTLYMCLGQEDAADLRAPMRQSSQDDLLYKAIDAAIALKPKGHNFVIDRHKRPSISRHMSTTGG